MEQRAPLAVTLGWVGTRRRVARRRRSRIVYPVQKIWTIVPHAVDGAADRPQSQDVVCSRVRRAAVSPSASPLTMLASR